MTPRLTVESHDLRYGVWGISLCYIVIVISFLSYSDVSLKKKKVNKKYFILK